MLHIPRFSQPVRQATRLVLFAVMTLGVWSFFNYTPNLDGSNRLVGQTGFGYSLNGDIRANPITSPYRSARDAMNAFLAGEFEPIQPGFNRGYTYGDQPLWMAFNVDLLPAARLNSLVLDIPVANLDRVSVWQTDPNGQLQYRGSAGDQIPQDETPLRIANPAFSLAVTGRTETTVLLLLQTRTITTARFHLYDPESYLQARFWRGLGEGVFFSMVGMAIVMTLMQFYLTRERIYLIWLCYVSMMAVQGFFSGGLAYSLIEWTDLRWINALWSLSVALTLASGIAFFSAFFNFGALNHIVHRITLMVAGLLPVVWLVNWLLPDGNAVEPVLWLALPMLLLLVFSMLSHTVTSGRQPIGGGPWVILYAVYGIFYILSQLGLIPLGPHDFDGYRVAGFLHLIALQVALVRTTRQIERQREQERTTLVTALEQQNRTLEQRVSERTRSIVSALEHVQKSEAEQRELMSMASHEIRTPAAMIRATLDSLRMLMPTTEPAIRQRIENMRQACDRLIRVTSELIQNDRIQGHTLRPRYEDIALRELLSDIRQHYPPDCPIRMVETIPDITLHTDPTLISIALYNLIDNALRYQPDDGPPLEIDVALIEPLQPRHRSHLELSVADNGPGIPVEIRSQIFERFSSTRAPKGGQLPGLGLAIVRRIVIALGGTIRVGDRAGGGTVFRINLPIDPMDNDAWQALPIAD